MPGHLNRFTGNDRGICSHIGNETHRTHAINWHTFIQVLGNAHGGLGSKTQLACCRLLKRTGDERRKRPAFSAFGLNRLHPPFRSASHVTSQTDDLLSWSPGFGILLFDFFIEFKARHFCGCQSRFHVFRVELPVIDPDQFRCNAIVLSQPTVLFPHRPAVGISTVSFFRRFGQPLEPLRGFRRGIG